MSKEIVPVGGGGLLPATGAPGDVVPGSSTAAVRMSMPGPSVIAARKAKEAAARAAGAAAAAEPAKSDDEDLADFSRDMLTAGIAQDVLDKGLKWWAERTEKAQAAEAWLHLEDAKKARKELEAAWGENYHAKHKRALEALRDLPPAIQIGLERATFDDGTMLLHMPATWKWLLSLTEVRQRGDTDTTMVPVDQELAQLEEMMGDRHSDYYRGPSAAQNQARYRDLQDAKRAGRSHVPAQAPEERELAEILHVMRTDRKRYNRDERLQARYRELIEVQLRAGKRPN